MLCRYWCLRDNYILKIVSSFFLRWQYLFFTILSSLDRIGTKKCRIHASPSDDVDVKPVYTFFSTKIIKNRTIREINLIGMYVPRIYIYKNN